MLKLVHSVENRFFGLKSENANYSILTFCTHIYKVHLPKSQKYITLIPCKVTHGLKKFQLDFSQALRLFQESRFHQLNT